MVGEAPIRRSSVAAFRIPTDAPEADGTLAWDATVLVVVELQAAGASGLGYGYADEATARLIAARLLPLIDGGDAFAGQRLRAQMVRAIRNLGRPGIASMAIACVDVALWDLQARLLGLPLAKLLGAVREEIPLYGSGGFTSYDPRRLEEQLGSWAAAGFGAVKMKVGAAPERDLSRVRGARAAIGGSTELFVDANGAYERKQALAFAERFAELGVTWFEEPVSSDDLDGLRLLRDRAPAGMRIAAGEYAYHPPDFLRLAQVVDVLQADATRCGGITGFLHAAALAHAFGLPLSAHTAPALHLHPCCAVPGALAPMEYFHDHVRIERMAFDGVVDPVAGTIRPDLGRPGHGLILRRADLARFELS
jgi:L-alanine-DL-glutamate epimerase-like enolase superfamily enzyme